MKKIFFAITCTALCLLTSCFGEPGSVSEFWQVVTIDKTQTPVSFNGYYTGETFTNFSNLKQPHQLGAFLLEDAQLALVKMKLEVDASYKSTLSVVEGQKIETLPVTKVTPSETTQPLLIGLTPIFEDYYAPTIWVREGFLNIHSTIPSKEGNYFLIPEKASNDSLFFKFTASYKEDRNDKSDNIAFYDLRTLRETEGADESLHTKMAEMMETLEKHRADSVKIFLVNQYIRYNYNYLGRDTIWTDTVSSNYFKYDF